MRSTLRTHAFPLGATIVLLLGAAPAHAQYFGRNAVHDRAGKGAFWTFDLLAGF